MIGSVRLARAAALAAVAILAGLPGAAGRGPFVPGAAFADEGWRTEFEAVCSKTEIAMSLTKDELADLIARCDALAPRIDAEDASTRKVSLRRLRMCRDLYRFVLEARDR